jgi:hypothetical protein
MTFLINGALIYVRPIFLMRCHDWFFIIYLLFLQWLRLLIDNRPIYEDATQLNDLSANKMFAFIH